MEAEPSGTRPRYQSFRKALPCMMMARWSAGKPGLWLLVQRLILTGSWPGAGVFQAPAFWVGCWKQWWLQAPFCSVDFLPAFPPMSSQFPGPRGICSKPLLQRRQRKKPCTASAYTQGCARLTGRRGRVDACGAAGLSARARVQGAHLSDGLNACETGRK